MIISLSKNVDREWHISPIILLMSAERKEFRRRKREREKEKRRQFNDNPGGSK